jgi:hypothetical protein
VEDEEERFRRGQRSLPTTGVVAVLHHGAWAEHSMASVGVSQVSTRAAPTLANLARRRLFVNRQSSLPFPAPALLLLLCN